MDTKKRTISKKDRGGRMLIKTYRAAFTSTGRAAATRAGSSASTATHVDYWFEVGELKFKSVG